MKRAFALLRDEFSGIYSVDADDFQQLIETLKNFDSNVDICYSYKGCAFLRPYVALEYTTASNQSYDHSYVQKVANLADELYRVIHNPCNWVNPPVTLYQVATLTKVLVSWESGYRPIVTVQFQPEHIKELIRTLSYYLSDRNNYKLLSKDQHRNLFLTLPVPYTGNNPLSSQEVGNVH